MANMMIETIRRKIETSGKSLNQIGRDTGVDVSVLWRIMHGGDCKTWTADVLLSYFGLMVAKKQNRKAR